MRENLQDLVDRVSAENWDRYLPAPSVVRRRKRGAQYHRPVALLAAAAVVVIAVVVPMGLASRLVTQEPPQPAASGTSATTRPVATPCVTTAASPGSADTSRDLKAAALGPADAVPGYEFVEKARTEPASAQTLATGIVPVPGLVTGQRDVAYSSMVTGVTGTSWQLMHQVFQYSPVSASAGYAAAEAQLRRTNLTIVSSRGGDRPEIIARMQVTEKTPMPKAADWAVLTRSGDCVLVVLVVPMAAATAVPAAGPGLAYLQAVAASVRAKAIGVPAPKLPLPEGAQPIVAPKGYLQPADLGRGTWRALDVESRRGLDVRYPLPTATCTEGPRVTLSERHHVQSYHGDVGELDWTVTESVLRMSTRDARKFMTGIRAYLRAGCDGSREVKAPSEVGNDIVMMHATRPTGSSEVDEAWIRYGGTVIHLHVSAISGTGDVLVPSAQAYLTSTARKAIERVKGR